MGNYVVNVAYPNYTKKINTIERPKHGDRSGVPVLVLNEPNGKTTVCNLNFVHHYDVTPSNNKGSNKNG